MKVPLRRSVCIVPFGVPIQSSYLSHLNYHLPFAHPHPFLHKSTPISFQVVAFVPNCNCLDWVVSAFICFLYFLSFSACFLYLSCSYASCWSFLLIALWLLILSSYLWYSSGDVIRAVINLLLKVIELEWFINRPIVSSGRMKSVFWGWYPSIIINLSISFIENSLDWIVALVDLITLYFGSLGFVTIFWISFYKRVKASKSASGWLVCSSWSSRPSTGSDYIYYKLIILMHL